MKRLLVAIAIIAFVLVGCNTSSDPSGDRGFRFAVVLGFLWMTALLIAPPVFLLMSLRTFRLDTSFPAQRWRRTGFLVGVIAAASAWVVLAVAMVSQFYLNHELAIPQYGWIAGCAFSIVAFVLCAFGHGAARSNSLLGGLFLCGLYFSILIM